MNPAAQVPTRPSETPNGLESALAACPATALIRSLGLPEFDTSQPALVALHAGAAYHRLAAITEVAETYCRSAQLAPEELAYLRLLKEPLCGTPPRDTALRFYRLAIAFDGQFAEAWFNAARIHQHLGESHAALDCFSRTISLRPHARAPGHAHLHANAHFHAACILEDLGQDTASLREYRAALAMLDNFGVHHARVARFLRRQGLIDEAIPQYEKLMEYGHRYFTEFTLPPLKVEPRAEAPETLEILYETSDRAPVVFWAGAYYRLAPSLTPISGARLAKLEAAGKGSAETAVGGFRALLRRIGGATVAPQEIRKADNIADLEPGN